MIARTDTLWFLETILAKKRLVRDADSAFLFMAANDPAADYSVPAARIAAVVVLERFAGLSLPADDAPGAAAGGSDEGIDDLLHFRLLDCTANHGGAYDDDCYATVI